MACAPRAAAGPLGAGAPRPACGAAAGVERIVQVIKDISRREPTIQKKIFLAQLGELAKRKSLKLSEELRKGKIPVAESLGKDSLKTQLRIADRMGAVYTLILGQREALEGTVLIRDMKSGRQETVKWDKVVGEIQKRLKK